MLREIRYFLMLSKHNIQGLLQYRVDFIITFLSGLLMQTVGIVFLVVLFSNVPEIRGWSLNEVALLYGCSFFSEGILTFWFQGTTSLAYYVRTGLFDVFLTRPISVTSQVIGAQTNLGGLGTAITGVVVIVRAISALGVEASVFSLVAFVTLMIVGVVIRVNLNFATTSLSFWLRASSGTADLVYATQEFGKYPIEVYPIGLRILLLTIIPHSVVTYIPAAVLLGRVGPVIGLGCASISCGAMILARRWTLARALKRYESSGH